MLTRALPTADGGAATDSYTGWERCNQWGTSCTDIDGAEDPSYRLTSADIGSRIVVFVWLFNSAGYRVAESAPTPTVALAAPPPSPLPPAPAPAAPLPVSRPAPDAFARAGTPAVTVHGATAIVDTGRTVACPTGAVACRLSATARPAGASAHPRVRPAVAGTAQIRVGAGSRARIAIA